MLIHVTVYCIAQQLIVHDMKGVQFYRLNATMYMYDNLPVL